MFKSRAFGSLVMLTATLSTVYRTDRRGHQLFEQDIDQHATTLRILFGAEDVRARVGACLLTGRAMISFSIEEKLRARGFFELLGTELDSVETREFALRALVDILHGAGHSAKMGVRSALAKACGRQLIELVLVLEGQGLVCALDLLLMAASSPKPGFVSSFRCLGPNQIADLLWYSEPNLLAYSMPSWAASSDRESRSSIGARRSAHMSFSHQFTLCLSYTLPCTLGAQHSRRGA